MQGIDQLIVAQPDITIDEIIENQGLSVSNETVRKAMIRLGHVYKKKSFYAAERGRVRCCGGLGGAVHETNAKPFAAAAGQSQILCKLHLGCK